MSPNAGSASGSHPPIAFFRNDDINELTPELIDVTRLLIEESVPIIHAVEPGNVTDECVDWLLEQNEKHGRLFQIMQHGYNHTKHSQGEFGGNRSYEEQYEDLRRGREIMDDRFGDKWFNAVNFPYGPYNLATIRAIENLDFEVFNGHFNPRLSRRVFYSVGHMLGKGLLLGRHISHHLETYPHTKLFTIDMAISYVSHYYGDYGSQECDFFDLDFLMNRFEEARRHINVIGWLLHHRYHHTEASLRLVTDTIAEMRSRVPDIEFWNFEEICQVYQEPALMQVG